MTRPLPLPRSGGPLICGVVLVVTLAGCGGASGNPANKAPKIIQSPTLPPQQPSNRPPADQQPKPPAAGNNSPKAAIATKPSPSKPKDDPFAEEDPRNLFEIAGEEAMDTIGPDSVTLDDRFTVGEVVPETDSTDFEIGAIAGGDGATRKGSSGRGTDDFPLPQGFAAVASYGYAEDGMPLRIRGDKTGVLMALVRGGTALIGRDDGPEESQPQFSPFLDSFYLDINEVTLEQYGKFRDDIKSRKNSRVQSPLNDGSDPDLPALGLPWAIAQGFAHWQGKELPTEAEFEYAARGPDGWRAPWGNSRAIWPKPRTPDTLVTIQSFPTDQTPAGIFDLAGNAREWCQDNYSETAHQDATNANPKLLYNWAGPKKGSTTVKVVKGNGPDWSAWHREGRTANEKHPDVGFRCVLRIKGSAGSASKGD